MAYYNRGVCHNDMGNYCQAVEDFKIALNVKPDDPDALKEMRYAQANGG